MNRYECEEVNCARSATRIWKGRKVCQDHLDYYKEKWDRIYMDLDD